MTTNHLPIQETPVEIDGARVILTAQLSEEQRPTGFAINIVIGFDRLDRLAICKYRQEPGYYLFYCDADWSVINDSYHGTKELAIEEAEQEFTGTQHRWV